MVNYFRILNSIYFGVGSFIFFRHLNKTLHLHNYVHELRVLYALSQLIIFGIYYYTIRRIKQKNDTTTLVYVKPASKNFIQASIASRRFYLEKSTDEKQVSTIVRDYDLAEVHKDLRRAAIAIVIWMCLHLKFGLTPPLFAQSILGIKASLTTKEAQIHIWGTSMTEDLQRPFKSETLLSKWNNRKKKDSDEPATSHVSNENIAMPEQKKKEE